jgi:hypothetical protein
MLHCVTMGSPMQSQHWGPIIVATQCCIMVHWDQHQHCNHNVASIFGKVPNIGTLQPLLNATLGWLANSLKLLHHKNGMIYIMLTADMGRLYSPLLHYNNE